MAQRRFFGKPFAGAVLAGTVWLLAPMAFLTSGLPLEGAGIDAQDIPLFSHERLQEYARSLSTRPHAPLAQPDDPVLATSYDQYRSIAFDRDQAVWKDEALPFTLEMFHPGFIYPTPVEVSLVDDEGQVTPMRFSPAQFTYGGTATPPAAEGLSYSGFRAHAPLNVAEVMDEFAVFQGATYFRGVGRGQSYGASARGLALGSGSPRGEEFPYFSRFWVETPAPDAESLVIHALMDSPSATGAYRFTVTPGDTSVMEVEATLFPRAELTEAGLAPLTSMFLFDQTNRGRFDDFRGAVHDSDGLQMLNGAGELIWRPLANPRLLQISAFVDKDPRGFGLMQRKREPMEYNDFTARYEARPSVWVEPVGDWGEGSVMLVEIPTEWETNDNIVAFWRPAASIPVGEAYSLAWRLHWGADAPAQTGLMRVTHTRAGASVAGKRFFAIDFDGQGMTMPLETLRVTAATSAGAISEPYLSRDERSGTLRATFELDPQGVELAELRLRLDAAEAPASETWLYRWTPN